MLVITSFSADCIQPYHAEARPSPTRAGAGEHVRKEGSYPDGAAARHHAGRRRDGRDRGLVSAYPCT
jgi:hypothetical protein